jgi:AraC-like DNA-binding protein
VTYPPRACSANLLDVDAASTANGELDGMSYEELANVFAAYEQATRLQVCFRPLSDRWGKPEHCGAMAPFLEHRSAFCAEVKDRQMPACSRWDNAALPTACSPPEGRRTAPFLRRCHAGAEELLLPIWDGGMLLAVVFIGQFARDPGAAASLRPLVDADLHHANALAVLVRSHLREMARELDGRRTGRTAGRRGIIDAYLQESLSDGPTLPALAARLSLSSSRAGHVVRELTGRSFRELVDERRTATAQDLLTSTDATLAWISRQAGFTDVAYFCRAFKHRTGMTPTSFRRRHRHTRWT